MRRLLLRVFPPAFRRRFGDDLLATFEDRWRGARRRGALPGAIAWLRSAADLIRHGLAERRRDRLQRRGRDAMMSSLLQDIRYGWRALARQPGVTFTAVAILALGIGATTAVFSVAEALVLRPLPFPHAERIVSLTGVNPSRGFSGNVAVPNFDDWRRDVDVIELGAAWTATQANLAGSTGAERVSAGLVTGDFFAIVGANPVAGRVFGDDAREPGLESVVVLSEGAWSRLYGGSQDAIGTSAVLDGVPHTIVGVVPAVAGMPHVEVWRPLARSGPASSRRNHAYRAYVRLRDGVTIPQATDQFNVVAARLEREFPDSNAGWRVSLTPLQDELAGELTRTVAAVGGVVALLLLIACTNVAGLLLSRAADRRGEFAVRTALGAGRRRLLRQVLTESVMLSLVGAGAGVFIAWSATNALTAVLVDADTLWRVPTLSPTVLAFALAVSIATGVIAGLAPAVSLRAGATREQLRAGASTSRAGRRTRSALAVAQLAMASVLLLASALLLAGTYRALQVDPGFDPTDVLTFRVTPPPATHADASAIDLFYTTLLERLGTLPQVASVGAMSNLPMAGNSTIRGVIRPGDPVPARGEEQYVLYQVSTPGYVAASGMQLLAGRDFTANDVAGSRPVALINESLARTLWPDGAAVGRQLLIFTDEDTPREVVGVLADIRYRGLDRAVLPQYFVPLSQGPTRSMSVAMRLDAPLDLADLRAVVESVDAALPVYDIRSLEELMRQSLSDRRALTTTMGLFGALAITLAAIGLHGIIATGVRERRREIGIRMAVGASTGQVRRLFLRQGLVLAATAVVLGLGVGTWILMSVDELTQGIDRPGPGLLAAVAAFVLVSALVATWLPTRVATRVDPVRTLRDGA